VRVTPSTSSEWETSARSAAGAGEAASHATRGSARPNPRAADLEAVALAEGVQSPLLRKEGPR
jgi:hypothetical protein